MVNRYLNLRFNMGYNTAQAARSLGIDQRTGRAWEERMKDGNGKSFRDRALAAGFAPPKTYDQLSNYGKLAYDDFEFFRRFHFGRLSSPWQIDAAAQFLEALKTPHKEYINLNVAPGSGKSTLLHDIECWLTVRNRAIRGIVGSATQRLAMNYNVRLRRSFERPRPPDVDVGDVAAGRAVEPQESLAKTYGRFQPDQMEVWRQEEFIVAQMNQIAIGEKEPTWQAFGLDTDYLGNRVDIMVWDDVVTKKTMRSMEMLLAQRERWDDEAETRLEPHGALFLVGQRLGPMDLYAYNKAKVAGYDDDETDDWTFRPSERVRPAPAGFDHAWDDDDDDEVENYREINPNGSKKPRMYRSIVYKAHYEDKCKHLHSSLNPRYWSPKSSDACLLDPIRLPWRELKQKMRSSTEKYRTLYQQEDVDPGSVLVPRHYVTGGEVNGEFFPGCYDVDRRYHSLPRNLSSSTMSIITVDPSPTNWWSVQWWLYDPETELRHFMDMERRKMGADQFLEYNPDVSLAERFSGVLEDLWQTSNKLARPVTILIIERNGAQRFLGQLEFFRRWCSLRNVSYYPHDTTQNKSDEKYGVQILATQYRHGRVRLPNFQTAGDMGFVVTRKLVDEVTTWPEGMTDDCVMAQWFLEWWIPRLTIPTIDDLPRRWVPTFVRSA